jgi:hypothetical protein
MTMHPRGVIPAPEPSSPQLPKVTPEAAAPGYSGQPYLFVGGIRQWYPVKTTTDKLGLVFQHIADNDGRVELVHHVGGRDYLVCYSKPVVR